MESELFGHENFFFSSRRRHTRFDCDWSSDVCSSDLHRRTPPAKAMDRHLSLHLAAHAAPLRRPPRLHEIVRDRKSTRLNSSHSQISYAVFCLKKKNIASSSARLTRQPRR